MHGCRMATSPGHRTPAISGRVDRATGRESGAPSDEVVTWCSSPCRRSASPDDRKDSDCRSGEKGKEGLTGRVVVKLCSNNIIEKMSLAVNLLRLTGHRPADRHNPEHLGCPSVPQKPHVRSGPGVDNNRGMQGSRPAPCRTIGARVGIVSSLCWHTLDRRGRVSINPGAGTGDAHRADGLVAGHGAIDAFERAVDPLASFSRRCESEHSCRFERGNGR